MRLRQISRPSSLGALGLVVAACAASVNPTMKKRTDELLAQVQPRKHREIPAPARFDPKAWAVGQWILIHATVHGEQVVQRTTIVSKDDHGLWVETETQDYHHHTLARVQYASQPRTANEALDLASSMTLGVDGEAPKPVKISDARDSMPGALQRVIVGSDDSESGRDNQTVPAGTFMRCVAYQGIFGDGAYAKPIRGWSHPEIPLMGVVRASSDDGEVKVELLDYGDTGTSPTLEPARQPQPAAPAPAPSTAPSKPASGPTSAPPPAPPPPPPAPKK